MLHRDSAFESNFTDKANSIPSFGQDNDHKFPFLAEEGGSFSAPKLDFTEIEQYQQTGEYNDEDRLSFLAENSSLFSDTDKTIDRDALLNSDKPASELLEDARSSRPFGEEDLETSEYNDEDRLSFLAENSSLFSDTDKAIDRDALLNSDKPASELLADARSSRPFGEEDLKVSEEIMSDKEALTNFDRSNVDRRDAPLGKPTE